ncbi:kelch-like ECH-associated protein 1B isoform X1 [Stomoxys calcitrans]|uniref:kelch-like ECH-associated protein 1B isoform X1 n=2 Tax=Stomoxys calcitrans TaxID=35570 RepID=UPI0027E31BF3|nr:kelch-like ECH-associated protein 1B isoform X1 [Stomoxys calcitrans]
MPRSLEKNIVRHIMSTNHQPVGISPSQGVNPYDNNDANNLSQQSYINGLPKYFPMDVEETEMETTNDCSRPMSNCQSPCSYGSSTLDEHDDLNAKEDELTFCMSSYAKEALKMMFMMRSHNMLTDVILEVKQELFPAHKVVLSAASPYFKAMFTGGLKETEMSRVQLQGVCPTAMGRIIYFMYTGHIRVTEVTVCQLLPAATMFQVPNVIDACCAFLERQLDPTNAIGIANFAEQHGCIELQKKANHFIERHFTQVCQEEEFFQLSAYQLITLIRRDELNVQGEGEVYNAVLKWVKYDEENRYPKMEHILFSVRCQLLTPTFLREQMKNCDVLRKVPACREYLAKIFKDLTLHKRPIVKERKPNTTRMIFVAGGFLRQSLDILEAYNVDDKTWTTLPSLRIPRSGLGAAFLKGVFYAVGGRNNCIGSSYDSDWVDRYNALTEQWRPCAPMSVPRHRVGVAVMDELMYAVGGSAGSEYHSTVEYYDPEVDRWFLVQPMHTKRLGVGVVVVNRLLYAIGGFDGHERFASVECYHPENNEWSFVKPMTCGRSGAGVAAINQYIYVVGGFDGTRQLSTVERYDTENQIWEHMAPIKIARSALSLTSLDGKLYAIGGFDGSNFLSIVEVYDPKTNSWEQGTPLSSGRSGHASAVIYQPSCVNNFMDCMEDESSKRDNDGGFNNENLSDQHGGSRGAGSGGGGDMGGSGSSSSQGFQTSFGSGGCRNCETEIIPSQSDNEDEIPAANKNKTNAPVEFSNTPSKIFKVTPSQSDHENEIPAANKNGTNAPAEFRNIPSKISKRRRCKMSWRLKKCHPNAANEDVKKTISTSTEMPAVSRVSSTQQQPQQQFKDQSHSGESLEENCSPPISSATKGKCKFAQCKAHCIAEAIRKYTNSRAILCDFVHCLLERHTKKMLDV